MGLPIKSITKAGVDTAWTLISEVLVSVTVRDQPTLVYDIATGANVITWGLQHFGKQGFLYLAKNIISGEGAPAGQARQMTCLMRWNDLPGPITLQGQIQEVVSGKNWQIVNIDSPPGEAIVIFELETVV